MRKLLNTLYILTPNVYLLKDGTNVVARVDGEETFRIPIHNLEGIITFSYMGASPGLMQLCVQEGVMLTFLTPTGRYIGSLEGPTRGNVLLRRTQYRIADDEPAAAHFAALFISAKIANQRSVLSRYMRDYHPTEGVEATFQEALSQLKTLQKSLAYKRDRMTVMGVEGLAAQQYFALFHHLIRRPEFTFEGRSRRPPRDETNALLSFFYTILAHEVTAALETVGLDPYVGFLHTDRPGRASLALDLMEELRAYIVDRFVLTVINKRQVAPSDFITQGENGYILRDEPRKELLAAWQQRKREEITHPFLQERIPIGLLPYAQALLLARCLRGDLDDYPVFLIQS